MLQNNPFRRFPFYILYNLSILENNSILGRYINTDIWKMIDCKKEKKVRWCDLLAIVYFWDDS